MMVIGFLVCALIAVGVSMRSKTGDD